MIKAIKIFASNHKGHYMFSPLLTDFYQLTMAQGYWQLGRSEEEAVFQLSYRKNPFGGEYAIACGLERVIEFLANYRFSDEDIAYLQQLTNVRRQPLFSQDFLDYLRQLTFQCDVDAIPEGTVVFPQEPIVRIRGPILQCQLIETPLLNFINFASLIATKAARICQAAQGDPVIEFGLRRAQGPDGGLTATRASYIGGCESTSNMLAGKLFGIPAKGTQAHSWVMSYPDELTAFAEFVKTTDSTILLVDTYDTLQGVRHAIAIGRQLRAQGRSLQGIRLDSGDLLELSCKARQLLDAAGFQETKIVASGDLEEKRIAQLKAHGAPIDIWGVGTRLVTAYDQPSLDAIYKLAALRTTTGAWQYKAKISDQPGKKTMPGIQQIRRYYHAERWIGDIIYDLELSLQQALPHADRWQDLLVPIFRRGELVYQTPSLLATRAYCQQQVQQFMTSNNRPYPVTLEPRLQALATQIAQQLS